MAEAEEPPAAAEPEPEIPETVAEIAAPPATEMVEAEEPTVAEVETEPDLAEAPSEIETPSPEIKETAALAEPVEVEEPPAITEPEVGPVVEETMPEIEPAPSPEIFKTIPAHEESAEVVRRDRFRRLTNFLYRRQATYTPPEESEFDADG